MTTSGGVSWRRRICTASRRGSTAAFVGIAHYFFHTNVWVDEVCYLADLFVDQQVRGRGAARLLIEAVAGKARERGCQRYYWLTQQHNVRARGLYDKVARFAGFIRYDYPMHVPG